MTNNILEKYIHKTYNHDQQETIKRIYNVIIILLLIFGTGNGNCGGTSCGCDTGCGC